jgi:hypothetical protein
LIKVKEKGYKVLQMLGKGASEAELSEWEKGKGGGKDEGGILKLSECSG